MKERIIENQTDLDKALRDIAKIDFPYVIGIGREVTRKQAQNRRYWATLDEHLRQVNLEIDRVSDYSGNSNLAVRKQIARQLSDEATLLLYCLDKKAVHEALKLICGIPTSTRLGTKQFSKFDTVMESTMMEMLGEVKAFASDCR